MTTASAVLNWSFPLYRAGGIQVRIHWTLPLFYVAVLIDAAINGFGLHAAIGLGILLALVLSHEYGHAITARRLREEAEVITLHWMGGAAYCGPGANTRDAMLITVMGPAVNVATGLVSGAAIVWLGLWDWSLLNPFSWGLPRDFGVYALLITFKTSFLLLALNLCVPAYPLDAGRLLLLWTSNRHGRLRGAKIATMVSIPIGFAIVLWALLQKEFILLFIGIYVLFEAYQIHRMIEFGDIDAHPAFPREPYYGGYDHTHGIDDSSPVATRRRGTGWFARWRAKRRAKADELRRREEWRLEQEEAVLRARVDQVLEKVSRDGMGSLSPEERRILDEASRKLRGS